MEQRRAWRLAPGAWPRFAASWASTQAEVAQHMGVTQGTVSAIEHATEAAGPLFWL
jgi:hypothetical protein